MTRARSPAGLWGGRLHALSTTLRAFWIRVQWKPGLFAFAATILWLPQDARLAALEVSRGLRVAHMVRGRLLGVGYSAPPRCL